MTRGAKRASWLAVAGARPNFVKIAPLVRAAAARGVHLPWVHTGQHYDAALSSDVARDLGLPPPIAHLRVGEGSASEQTARVLERLAPVLARRAPRVLVVVGDVTSTLAAALCAANAGIAVAHVEAGLRSFDASMPEERNRVLVDRLAARLYVTEPAGVENLAREGVDRRRVRLVGNVMIDALRAARPGLVRPRARGAHALATLHRPSNVDDPERLRAWCRALADVARLVPVRFPLHPRTRARLHAAGALRGLRAAGVETLEPMPYLAFVDALADARVVMTDSGGIQEEAAFLGVPCLTLRTTTERPSTLVKGRNRLLGDDPRRLVPAVRRVLRAKPPTPARGRLLDGKAADRIVSDLLARPL